MATCYRHPKRETGVSCSNCGNPICTDCMTPTNVGMRCPECARQKTQVRTIQNVRAGGVEVTRVIIAINVLAYIAQISSGAGLGDATSGTVYARGLLYGPFVGIGHDYWRLVTSGFLHANIIHIGLNMYLLWIVGQMLEPLIGSVRFAVLYMVALLAGSLGVLILEPRTAAIGASGAVFGVMGAVLVEMRARGVAILQSWLGILLLINLGLSFRPGIAVGAHIGGLIGGVLVALLYRAADRQRSRMLGLGGAVAIGVAVVVASIAAAPTTVFSG
jgi:membrane associated rhomboid family serine protease